jgi:hypothetical protein
MNTFKRKSLYVLLAGLSGLGAGSAGAVSVNPDGLGQVLLYPYYTVRSDNAGNAYNTYFSVVNSTGSAKVVKVKFLESKRSTEVLDFNLFLSPYDVWVGGVVATANGAGVFTPDTSCTVPVVSRDPAAPNEFVNYVYAGSEKDLGPSTLDRTREGYIEIIEMGSFPKETGVDEDGDPILSEVFATTKHSSGVPECDKDILEDTDLVNDEIRSPWGGLFGSMYIINVASGTMYDADPTALDGFRDTALYTGSGSASPDLRDADPNSVVIYGNQAINGTFNSGEEAVSSVLMHDSLLNEFVVLPEIGGGTDWIVTMPTKRYFIGQETEVEQGGKTLPDPLEPGYWVFQKNYGAIKTTTDSNGDLVATAWGSCDEIKITRYDREEGVKSSSASFSPPPPSKTDTLCDEANVITWNGSNVLNSVNALNIAETTFKTGWGKIAFPGKDLTKSVNGVSITGPSHILISTNDVTYYGLPTIGFSVQRFVNGTLPGGVLSNYGGAWKHKQSVGIDYVD